jgi:predicted RNase H-like nuclease (RuvC/YqgF family)
MSESWADYMRQHGADEYSAWDEAVRPYTERIEELDVRVANLSAELKRTVEEAADHVRQKDAALAAKDEEIALLRRTLDEALNGCNPSRRLPPVRRGC